MQRVFTLAARLKMAGNHPGCADGVSVYRFPFNFQDPQHMDLGCWGWVNLLVFDDLLADFEEIARIMKYEMVITAFLK